MSPLQSWKILFAGNLEPLAPKCFYACKSFLVLEDLSAAAFRMLERRRGLDLDQCLQVMRTLAKFHAASVVLYQQDPDSMKEYEVSFYSDPVVKKTWPKFSSGSYTIKTYMNIFCLLLIIITIIVLVLFI
jgi:hypothetical protein